MSYKGKITNADTAGKGVVGLPDTPNLTVNELQRKFDELETDVIIPKHNEFIADLETCYNKEYVRAAGATTISTRSFAFGKGINAAHADQFVHGTYNEEGDYIHAVGNGTSDTNRSNAYTLDREGNAQFAGEVTDGKQNRLSDVNTVAKRADNMSALNHQTLGYYKKNLYDNIGNLVEGKRGSLTLEKGNDDTFNITGTIYAQEFAVFQQKPFTLKKGKYILSEKISMSGRAAITLVNSAGELLNGEFEISKDEDTVYLQISVAAFATGSTSISVTGQAVMVRSAQIEDDTYESYVEDVDTRFKNLSFTAVKGNKETEYRTGNVNLTPANIGALAEDATAKASNKLLPVLLTNEDLDDFKYVSGISYYASGFINTVKNTGFAEGTDFTLIIYSTPTGVTQRITANGVEKIRSYDAYNGVWLDWIKIANTENAKVNLAEKATADGNGNNIVSTYATKDELASAGGVGIETTTESTLINSSEGGLKINSMDGESQQNGTPTPDAPIDIESVEVSEIWTHGKNLYDEVANNVEINHSGIKFTKNEYGNLTLSGTTTASINAVMNPFTLPAGTYYYQKGTTKNVSVRLYNRTASAFIAYDNGSFTLAEESTLDVRVQSNSGSAISGTIKIQIEKGSMTEYEPYTETKETLSAPIVLRSIGDAKDVLCKQNGVYGVARKYIPFVIDGTQEITRETADVNGYRFRLTYALSDIYTPASMSTVADIMSDKFPSSKWTDIYYGRGSAIGTNVKQIGWYDEKFKNFTVAEMKAWLTENPISGFYRLATPTFEPLPLADQIALHKLETFGGVTYLFTDSTIEPIIEVEYGTSKVGGYAIKGMNTSDANSLMIEQLKTLTNELATQLVAGSEA